VSHHAAVSPTGVALNRSHSRRAVAAAVESLEPRRLLASTWGAEPQLIHQDVAAANFPNITGAGVAVAVMDTGIDYTNPLLGGGFGPGHKVVAGFDFADNDSDPIDTFGHGTNVAGVIAANPFEFDGQHFSGIAPNAQLVALRVDAGDDPVPPERIEQALKPLLRECYLGPSNCLIRRDLALSVGGSDERIFVQDYSLLLRLAARAPFIALDVPVVLHPAAPQDRLNDGGPQLLHDTNLTVVHFLAEHDVPPELATMATRRAMTRAWLWAKRREGVTPLSRWYWLRLASYLPLPALRARLLEASCGAFTLSRDVRRSQPSLRGA